MFAVSWLELLLRLLRTISSIHPTAWFTLLQNALETLLRIAIDVNDALGITMAASAIASMRA